MDEEDNVPASKPPHLDRETDSDVVTRCANVSGCGPSDGSGVSRNRDVRKWFLENRWSQRAWWTEMMIALQPHWDIMNQLLATLRL